MNARVAGAVVTAIMAAWAAQMMIPELSRVEAAPKGAVQALLDATVQIDLYAPLGENGHGKVYATGLGTLVEMGGERLIVTHDHWGPALDGATQARFSSADGKVLLELDGAELRALMRGRDGGTMLLAAPEILTVRRPVAPRLKALAVGDGRGVQPGATVTVAYRLRTEGSDTVSTFEALVTGMEVKDGRAAWRLESTRGEHVAAGDSGGGIWQNGRLVGNLWALVIETVYSSAAPAGQDVMTNRSVGAALDLLDSAPAGKPATSQPERTIPGDGRMAHDPGL